MTVTTKSLTLSLNDSLTAIKSVKSSGRELIATEQPLFLIRARDAAGGSMLFSPESAEIEHSGDMVSYRYPEFTLYLTVKGGDDIRWSFRIENRSSLALEFFDIANIEFSGTLRKNGGDCAIVSSYNEGLLVEDYRKRPQMIDPEYPSKGNYMMYPYMLSSPLMMWLFGNEGMLMHVEDHEFSPKGFDYCTSKESARFRTRLFLGGEAGGDIDKPMEYVWTHFNGDWQDGAEIYREYAYNNINASLLSNTKLPEWYTDDMPLVITYPVRGHFDTDAMEPNKLYPYTNVLPLVDEFAERTGCKIMVILMHWEGTAPWAPPYVWPPYGGEDNFRALMDRLHADGNLLGVYCSGFGFTEQSNLIAEYNCEEMIRERGLDNGFCLAPDQSLPYSNICRPQRKGYDICAASEVGKMILNEAVPPLLRSGVDYVQVLDQNHGGGMYFCYAKDHGHPPVPGGWMTKATLELLDGWKKECPNTLLGCESAAAEPYIGRLRLSDNRYELCYMPGKPIPLYSYLYHRYLHNFMGNQVCDPLEFATVSLCARIAYSFLAGDMITLVINDEGEIMSHWGMQDFSHKLDRDAVIGLCRELHKWHKIYPEIFKDGEMAKSERYTCDTVEIGVTWDNSKRTEDKVYSTAWKCDGKTVQLFVNYTEEAVEVKLENKAKWRDADGNITEAESYIIPALTCVATEK